MYESVLDARGLPTRTHAIPYETVDTHVMCRCYFKSYTTYHLLRYGPCLRTHSAGTGRMRELKREGCGVTLLLVQRGEAVVVR